MCRGGWWGIKKENFRLRSTSLDLWHRREVGESTVIEKTHEYLKRNKEIIQEKMYQ